MCGTEGCGLSNVSKAVDRVVTVATMIGRCVQIEESERVQNFDLLQPGGNGGVRRDGGNCHDRGN
jgi:hypothetical protein